MAAKPRGVHPQAHGWKECPWQLPLLLLSIIPERASVFRLVLPLSPLDRQTAPLAFVADALRAPSPKHVYIRMATTYAAFASWRGCGARSMKNWRAALTSAAMLPANRLA